LAKKRKGERANGALAGESGTAVQVVDEATESAGVNGNGSGETGLLEGLIVEGNRGMYRVETSAGALVCTIRGRLRKQLVYATSASTGARKSVRDVKVKTHDPVAVGDRVRVLPSGGDTGVIEEIVERAGGAFSRRDPGKGQGRLTSIAGLDQIVATFAAREPTPHLRVLDRLLVLAEAQEIAATICIGKTDLGVEPWLAERLDVYRALGYPVLTISAHTGEGVDALREHLAGRTSALLGPSGVGKSSLLNALQPDLGLQVSGVSTSTGKGRHTTTGTRLFPLDGPAGGYIADTAGFRALALDGNAFDRLDWCFREFRPVLTACAWPSDCTHLHEPGCAVREAVWSGAIDRERYDSYRRLRNAAAESSAFNFDGEE
jgi:ribosome biogenesis GTPase